MTETNPARNESASLPSYSQLLKLARRWRAQNSPATSVEQSTREKGSGVFFGVQFSSETESTSEKDSGVPSGPRSAPNALTRVAVIGNSTLQFLRDPLEYTLAQRGVPAELLLGDFDNYVQEILSLESRLHKFQPQIVILLLDHHSIKCNQLERATWIETQTAAQEQLDQIRALWDAIRSGCGAMIVQSNIALPIERSMGHLSAKTPGSRAAILRTLNELLAQSTPDDVSIIDLEHLSGIVGKQAWFDSATWYTTHQSFGFAGLPTLVHHLSAVVAGILGRSHKCLVLDLDNTLWGGTIGDAGLHGIQLGVGDPHGEPFVDFQKYCLELKQRGVLLAVCSKNDDSIARQPFLSHPDMILKLNDFSSFVANWDDKATNIRRIAEELNLGLDSFVFVDDNPTERDLVRSLLPEVTVPELPEDPAMYRLALDHGHYFEVAVISSDDLQRSSFYAAEQQRRHAAVVATDTTEYLKSLQQECETGTCDELTLPRILQLLNKTNQWNLTTRRFTEYELRKQMDDPAVFVMWLRSRDRFGDNGLVSVVIAREVDSTFHIDDWVMSCRVFQRGIEFLVFNELLDQCRTRRLAALAGRYVETPKNKLVVDWYQTIGFTRDPLSEPGETQWCLELNGTIGYRPHFIKHLRTFHRENSSQETNHVSRAA